MTAPTAKDALEFKEVNIVSIAANQPIVFIVVTAKTAYSVATKYLAST